MPALRTRILALFTLAILTMPLMAGAVAPSTPVAAHAPSSAALVQAIGLAKEATRMQAGFLGFDLAAARPPSMAHASLEEAVQALLALHGVETLDAVRAELRTLDALSIADKDALRRFVDAFLAFEAATRAAYPPGEVPTEIPAGMADIFTARNVLLDASLALPGIHSMLGAPEACSIAVPPAFAFDLGGCDSAHADDVVLLLDVGGNDRYTNDAGGAYGLRQRPASALVDLGGADAYILDEDAYGNTWGGTGGAAVGAGFLMDMAGADTYVGGSQGVHGGGSGGAGFLLDVEGDDAYTADRDGVNGGAYRGSGLLIDLAGADTYAASYSGVNGGAYNGGSGSLLDLAGDDNYQAGSFGVNGGVRFQGRGLLLDGGGWDVYEDDEGGAGIDRTVVPKGDVGAQVDMTPASTGATQTVLLAQVENASLLPRSALPPPLFGGLETPDHPGTSPVPLGNTPGVGPVPTPPVGRRVGAVSVYDDGAQLCVDVIVDDGPRQPLACVGRQNLGPADALVPRGETPLVVYDPPDPSVAPRELPTVPGTDPSDVPDVEPTPSGQLGETRATNVTLSARYTYDATRVVFAIGLLGTVEVFQPFAPSDAPWFVAHGADVPLTVSVLVYEDGVEARSAEVAIPWLGQLLATQASP